jgi:para-nitrobenzyl esterase
MTIVATIAGQVQAIEKGGVLQYRGIPFARANRFQAPLDPSPWDGVRVCDSFAPVAPQGASAMVEMLGSTADAYDEGDCLALNVFTPAIDDRRRPVMVWIHGGAFLMGSGSSPWYNGSFLARRGDVVVVTINYRLGVFGYLHLADHLDDEAFAGSGNNGVRDQIAALRWVRDNISAFGGDPDRVTIFGESAGGMSVGTLLGNPAAAGLFRGAIPQSGAASHVLSTDQASAQASRLLEELGLTTAGADGLLSMSTDQLIDAQNRMLAGGRGELELPFSPVVDGVVVPEPPLSAVAAGASAGVAVLAGTTADEYRLFAAGEIMAGGIDEAKLRRRAGRLFGDRADDALDIYRRSRPAASPQDVWCAMATDWTFRIPAVRLAEAHLAAGGQHWLYRFSYRSSSFGGQLGACHAIDIPFVFDNLGAPGLENLIGAVDERARALADVTAAAWVAMAQRGDPNHPGLPEWPSYDTDRRPVLDLDVTRSLLDDPGGPEREIWAGLP